MDYVNICLRGRFKNKPNSNPIKANSKPIKPIFTPYAPKTNPIKPNFKPVPRRESTGICIPKLLRPVRIEKQGYRDVAEWLRGNTAPEDVVAVPDMRVSFYAERKGVPFGKKVLKGAKYVVKFMKDEDDKLHPGRTVKEEYSVWVDKRKKKKKLVIYKVQ